MIGCMAAGLFGQTAPIYADFGIAGKACCMARDGHGGMWIAGIYNPKSVSNPGSRVRAIHLGPSGAPIATWTSPVSDPEARVSGVALDSAANLIVVGGGSAAFVMQLAPDARSAWRHSWEVRNRPATTSGSLMSAWRIRCMERRRGDRCGFAGVHNRCGKHVNSGFSHDG